MILNGQKAGKLEKRGELYNIEPFRLKNERGEKGQMIRLGKRPWEVGRIIFYR